MSLMGRFRAGYPYLLLSCLLIAEPNLVSAAPKGKVTLDDAVESVRDRTRGRVLSAETEQNNGGRVHHIKVLTRDGRVKRFRIDGASGDELPPSKRPGR